VSCPQARQDPNCNCYVTTVVFIRLVVSTYTRTHSKDATRAMIMNATTALTASLATDSADPQTPDNPIHYPFRVQLSKDSTVQYYRSNVYCRLTYIHGRCCCSVAHINKVHMSFLAITATTSNRLRQHWSTSTQRKSTFSHLYTHV
jgi:hypothetical protein